MSRKLTPEIIRGTALEEEAGALELFLENKHVTPVRLAAHSEALVPIDGLHMVQEGRSHGPGVIGLDDGVPMHFKAV